MAIFSRRRRDPGDDDETQDPVPAADAAPQSEPADDADRPEGEQPVSESEPPASDSEPVPQVGISITAYRSAAVPQTAPEPPAQRPASSPHENALLRQALLGLTPESTPIQAVAAARQLLQGNLFVRVKGDVRALTEARSPIPWAVTREGDEVFVLVYSGRTAMGAAMERDGDTDTSAVAFPALTLLARILGGDYAGIIVDPSSPPARLTLKREFLERALAEADPQVALKTLLAGPRGADTAAEIGRAMESAPLFVAVGTASTGGAPGIAEVRAEDGARLIQVFSHPLEVIATGRGDRPVPFPAAQLGKALRDDPALGGVILDPAGPWIRLSREDLSPVIGA